LTIPHVIIAATTLIGAFLIVGVAVAQEPLRLPSKVVVGGVHRVGNQWDRGQSRCCKNHSHVRLPNCTDTKHMGADMVALNCV